jgi:hypothetical protein
MSDPNDSQYAPPGMMRFDVGDMTYYINPDQMRTSGLTQSQMIEELKRQSDNWSDDGHHPAPATPAEMGDVLDGMARLLEDEDD